MLFVFSYTLNAYVIIIYNYYRYFFNFIKIILHYYLLLLPTWTIINKLNIFLNVIYLNLDYVIHISLLFINYKNITITILSFNQAFFLFGVFVPLISIVICWIFRLRYNVPNNMAIYTCPLIHFLPIP